MLIAQHAKRSGKIVSLLIVALISFQYIKPALRYSLLQFLYYMILRYRKMISFRYTNCKTRWKYLQPRQIATDESKNSCHAWNQLLNDEANAGVTRQ